MFRNQNLHRHHNHHRSSCTRRSNGTQAPYNTDPLQLALLPWKRMLHQSPLLIQECRLKCNRTEANSSGTVVVRDAPRQRECRLHLRTSESPQSTIKCLHLTMFQEIKRPRFEEESLKIHSCRTLQHPYGTREESGNRARKSLWVRSRVE